MLPEKSREGKVNIKSLWPNGAKLIKGKKAK